MSFLMSSGNIVSLLDFRILGGIAQIISFEPLKNGCYSYFSPYARWACEQVVPEDMNDVRGVDVDVTTFYRLKVMMALLQIVLYAVTLRVIALIPKRV